MSPLHHRTAALLLRLAVPPASPVGRRALATVLAAADAGDPNALEVVGRVVAARGSEAAWEVWLGLRPDHWWGSPVVPVLEAGGGTIPGRVVDTAWTHWLHDPDPELWSMLRRWNRPAGDTVRPRARALTRLALGDDSVPLDPRVLAHTAARFDHPIGERARDRLLTPTAPADAVDPFCAKALYHPGIREFCLTHRLAPSDEVDRAVFFVRTGQHEQYQALDPDGTLLALGYRGASKDQRAQLRAAIADRNDIDTLRVMAGQRSDRDDFVRLSRSERSYLIRQLTLRGDWERLWPLVPLLTLPDAVSLARRFGEWRPSGEDDCDLFAALRAADPRIVNDGLSALSVMPSRVRPVSVTLGDSHRFSAVRGLDFSADGKQLAFIGSRSDGGYVAGIVDLPGARVTQYHEAFEQQLSQVAHIGPDSIVVVEDDTRTVGSRRSRTIYSVDDRGVRQLPLKAARYCGLSRVAGDRAFMVAVQRHSTTRPEFELCLSEDGGPPAPSSALRRKKHFHPWGSAVAPDGRLIVVFGAENMVVGDLADGAVNELDHGPVRERRGSQVALSPSTLVRATGSGGLLVWHDPLTSTRPPAHAPVWPRSDLPTGLAWSPALHRFVTVRQSHLEILAVPPTPEVPLPGESGEPEGVVYERIELVGAPAGQPFVRLSPQGDLLAMAGKGSLVHLYELTPKESALTRSMGSLAREDLHEVLRLQQHGDIGHTARHTLALLRSCLEHRFRHDIGIGDASGPAVVSEYDIELGG